MPEKTRLSWQSGLNCREEQEGRGGGSLPGGGGGGRGAVRLMKDVFGGLTSPLSTGCAICRMKSTTWRSSTLPSLPRFASRPWRAPQTALLPEAHPPPLPPLLQSPAVAAAKGYGD